ncbi:MAG: BMC domain-containing protein [Propionibacteriaceae bacterium]|jgi:ethanolamine utilization protein EutS|nr:BMC domain-containing protein [Propionibacteriaceae bacterium]
MFEDKQRIIQEFVPGKQVTLAHIIANPDPQLYVKVGLNPSGGSIGILTITPSDASILAADVATKSSGIELAFVDRFNGSLIMMGRLSDVEAAMRDVLSFLTEVLRLAPAEITRT